MDHGVPCVGYCFSRRKQSLKDEYKALTGREIGNLRKQGIEVTEEERIPMFAFLGDTTAQGIFGESGDNPATSTERTKQTRNKILACPTVIMECSFLTDDNRDQAARSKHVLWSDLRPHIESNPDVTFVLMHFSHRYSRQEVSDFFAREENYLPNVVPWIPSQSPRIDGGGAEENQSGGGVETVPQYCEEVWSHY